VIKKNTAMKKLFGILSVMLCATSMSYAQADGSAALQSSDVEMAWNGAVKEKKVIKSGSCGANVKYELYDDYTLRIYGSGEMSKFLYWGDGFLHDTSVPWIYEIKKIKSVVIEDGVTNIGDESFNDCSALTKVSIPNSVKSIGYAAFRECYALTKVTIPNSVNHIAECAFYGCRSLAEVNLPNGITSIENDVFNGCAFTELTIPSSVTSIGECAFCSCPFTEITIPSNVKSVGKYAFYNCSLEKVNISNGVTSIGDYALLCDNLKYVKIGKDVTEIGDQVFPQYYDENLVEVDEKTLKQLFKHLVKQTVIMKDLENNGKNENTVQFYEYFNTQKVFAIVMEKCDLDLNKYFIKERKDNYKLEEIKELLKQLNNTFILMNDKNIIHGDLKLENILIKREKGRMIYKLTDYGMNKEFLELSENLLELNGAPKYTAPEILKGGISDKKSDLWSLGVIIYILFSRIYPYEGYTNEEVLHCITTEGRKKLKHISNNPQFDHLIRVLLTINPEDRINWKEYFEHPFLTGGDCWKFYSEPILIGNGPYYQIQKVKSLKRNTNEEKAVKNIDLKLIRKKIEEKELRPCTEEDLKIYIDDFIQETENMELMRGPERDNKNTIIFYEYFQTENEFCIVQELCNGSLKDILRQKKKFTEKEIYQILSQLNNTFRILKKNNLSHKDLRLEKILIKKGEKEEDTIYKLTGFELNKRVDKLVGGAEGLVTTKYKIL
jgi:serine/threonine protein kinase